jgi:hypothetical protein
MVSIFIPVLWVCLNSNCQFLQSLSHHTSEEQCQQSMDIQKQGMLRQAARAGENVVIEGTCITANIKKEFLPANIKKETT